jgi:hypothetical protein
MTHSIPGRGPSSRRPVYLVAVAVLLLIVVSAVAQPVDGHRL